ncbi:MAG: 5,6-dimethylbenzimidazole synthase [Oceanospirillaceae bacterium]|jgi:5,6-dimethylbenzimidazole synthase|nr:5,6-dimethylbenzimidazole synthase [Oceanospirillaceae bacterium]MBT4443343.1 5,6-dimethylbenzimidazole synthase [Oceanospirillaceae bacterium]MBT6077368.1 5,6-dimethylbenzimidazole synthase [Oceanospirillaceae bacterium]
MSATLTDAHQHDLAFAEEDRHGLYKTLFNRRDVRSQFKPDPVPDEVLARVLYAAHHAPSVGFMQPWNFTLVNDDAVKRQVYGLYQQANEAAANEFEDERQQQYRQLKLAGILDAPLNICITCDRERAGPIVLGRQQMPEMDLFSSVCAVQNLWLAARAEGLGVGWVSIMDPNELKQVLGIPAAIVPIAYLCVGYVDHFLATPELANKGWRQRLPLGDLVYTNQWGAGAEADLLQTLEQQAEFPYQF